MKSIRVVAAIIKDKDKILATKRSYGEFKGGWEFPGGKIEEGEDKKTALIREIKEELNANIEIDSYFATIDYTYPNFHMIMDCYICNIDDFVINEEIHDEAKWLTKDELDSVNWLAADEKIVNKLKIYLSSKIAVSACLLGDNCRYNGKNNYNKEIEHLLKDKEVYRICPEILTGLSIPRKPVEIKDNKVITQDNEDMTEIFLHGVDMAWEKLKDKNIDLAILKASSPTCGSKTIYDGTFSHTLVEGNGLFAKLLKDNKIMVISEKDIE
ncbi:DUF523 domain-containing protein [Megamonas rupellensis]|uniref:DUF523 domain-containing protein n=1 Tax=Megamonas rupellensis TaxID=491921 RepID=A0A412CCZ6_9FIRM|nr:MULTISPECIES: 2-thiouracil desulfurase family protein [Megamonas]RGQ80457.1 DUF523 domain-containing protein [Megamonas rupellensis]